MALTINELRRERRLALRDLRKQLRSLDTSVEKSQRFLNSLLQRQTKIPEAADLDKVWEFYKALKSLLFIYEKGLSVAATIFTTV